MKDFKIENFERQYPGLRFPSFVSLTPPECEKLRAAVRARLAMPEATNGQELLERLLSTSTDLVGENAEKADFDLASALRTHGVEPLSTVYVQWGAFSDIDRMSFLDLARHFDDIWYPSADDVEIFDDSLEWFLFIQHYGALSLGRPGVL